MKEFLCSTDGVGSHIIKADNAKLACERYLAQYLEKERQANITIFVWPVLDKKVFKTYVALSEETGL